MEYASNSKGNTGVALGAVGTGLGAINALAGLGTMAGFGYPRGGYGYGCGGDSGLLRELMDAKMQAAILAADNDTDRKIVEAYTVLDRKVNEANERFNQFSREQAEFNGVAKATMGGMRSDIDELLHLTVRRVRADRVCPEPMPRYNAWEAPTTEP